MGIIYATTMDPTKTELLADWLPRQDFYRGNGQPQLATIGGFRLEDPDGEVGMEFIVARDEHDGMVYHLPLSYRGAPFEGGEEHLLGTSQHGVLGLRYIYNGPADPVWDACVRRLFAGDAVPQHQNISDTDEPRVGVAAPGHAAGDVEVIRHLQPQGTPESNGHGNVVIGIWQDETGAEQRGPVLRMA